MLIADSLDLSALMAALSAQRPIFHSEADFQHSLAWTAHTMAPHLQIRLEAQPEPSLHLDLLIARPNSDAATAIELKYLTHSWEGQCFGEAFRLRNQSARDIRGYDVIRDVTRIELLTRTRPTWNGLVLVITNDPWYWNPRGPGQATNAEAFRLHEGTALSGIRGWAPGTGAGTMRDREEPLSLTGNYTCRWHDYSRLEGDRGTFRSLALIAEKQVLPSPGWYPDPSRAASFRWWDGTRWTDRTNP